MFHGRFLEIALSASTSRNKIRLLFGARQTGKTALLHHVLGGQRSHFVDLQSAADRRRFEADPGAFSREIQGLPRSVRAVVVDEIQKVPALLDELQGLYDSAPARWQFYATGSSARKLRTRSVNLLPGRSHGYHLYPVCAWEIARDEPGALAPLPRRGRMAPPFPVQPLSRVLVFGSLPGIRAERSATAQATLATYVDHYLEEEIRREALVREMGPFAAFVRLAAAESGGQINLAKLSQESGVPASSIKNYYQVLVDTFVGYWVPAYARRARKRLLTTPRFFFFDLGVRNTAAELPLDSRLVEAQTGRLLEHWVAHELIARAGYLGRGHRVSFWRTVSGAEVDFVWESPREDIPVEVKATARPRPADARHLEIFLDQHPERARRGLVVCRCPHPEQLTERVRAVPWQEL